MSLILEIERINGQMEIAPDKGNPYYRIRFVRNTSTNSISMEVTTDNGKTWKGMPAVPPEGTQDGAVLSFINGKPEWVPPTTSDFSALKKNTVLFYNGKRIVSVPAGDPGDVLYIKQDGTPTFLPAADIVQNLSRYSGKVPLSVGLDFVSVSNLSLNFIPTKVRASCTKPAMGIDNIYPVVKSNTLSQGGFIADLSAAPTIEGYELHFDLEA